MLALGHSLDHLPIEAVLWVTASILAGIVLCSFIVPEAPRPPPQRDAASFGDTLRRPEVQALLGACFLMSAAHGALYVFYSIYLVDIGYDKGLVGWMWTLGVLAEIVVFMWMPRLTRRFSLRAILLFSFACAVARFLMIGWGAHSLALLLFAQVLHGATFGAYHAAAIAAVNEWFPGPAAVARTGALRQPVVRRGRHAGRLAERLHLGGHRAGVDLYDRLRLRARRPALAARWAGEGNPAPRMHSTNRGGDHRMQSILKIALPVLLAGTITTACQTVQTTHGGAVGVQRSQLMMVSAQEVEQASNRQYQQMVTEARRKNALDRDPATVQRVRRIVSRLTAQTGAFRPDAPSWAWRCTCSARTSSTPGAWPAARWRSTPGSSSGSASPTTRSPR